MAIAYPLTVPAELVLNNLVIRPRTVVGENLSPFTKQRQTIVSPGQWWELTGTIPPLPVAKADPVIAFLLSLNGVQGTFSYGDPSRPTTRGTANGAWSCGAGNVADSTTLVTAGAGQLAVGDWIQILTFLHKVIKVVDATHYDVFPRLRSAYPNGTVLTYTNAKGLFCLMSNQDMDYSVSVIKHTSTQLNAKEALT